MVEEKIEAAVSDFNMESKMDGILVGFSGGADSSALLFYLNKRAKKNGGGSVYAAHINHMIRGKEADRDESFCRSVCKDAGIELWVERADVPKIAAERKESVEEAARNVRYRTFFDILSQNPEISFIATAHNAEDNMETVIFNMLRGTGIRGLSGIPPVRGFRIIRPLIYCTKSEIIGYCIANNIKYVTDSTNADVDYTRNYIRSELIPKFSRINPQPEIAISRLCSLLRDDDMFIHKFAREFIETNKIETTAMRELLKGQDAAVLSRVVIAMYRSCADGGDEQLRHSRSRNLDCNHIKSVMSVIQSETPRSRISLPGKICAYVTKNEVSFLTEEQYETMNAPREPFEHELGPGENNFDYPAINIALSVNNEKDYNINSKNIYKLSIHKVLDFDKINGKIFIRNRRPGDRYFIGGMNRNIKKLFCDNKIPVHERGAVPLVCSDSGIIWIPGFEAGDYGAVSESTKKFLHIVYSVK